jgi:hypothetical protein
VYNSAHRSAVCLSVTNRLLKTPACGLHRAISLCTFALPALYPSSGSASIGKWAARSSRSVDTGRPKNARDPLRPATDTPSARVSVYRATCRGHRVVRDPRRAARHRGGSPLYERRSNARERLAERHSRTLAAAAIGVTGPNRADRHENRRQKDQACCRTLVRGTLRSAARL